MPSLRTNNVILRMLRKSIMIAQKYLHKSAFWVREIAQWVKSVTMQDWRFELHCRTPSKSWI